ncbi:baseplate J/gp47 family protein [Paenibacillus daejeonensis]|uniref:baseplate J/gp47 family protein n=1 Tax=Paenibacillus daejeonensis TaxID=135193 RepID=UPI00037892F9|nr:baseplate J/gp47 family protein [Paenibacillus daejeonensis]
MKEQRAGGTQLDHPYPVIDTRTQQLLIEQLKKMAPFYAPEWRFSPEDPDPGTALALMFTHLLEGNIRRLNQVPFKSFLAFLNQFHVELAPAKPALAQVTFYLTEGTREPVVVERGTQLAAQLPGEPEPIVFETAQTLLLTTARLLDLVAVSPRSDRIVRLATEGDLSRLSASNQGIALFGSEGENEQEHVMYIRHDFLFWVEHPAYIEIRFQNSQHASAAAEAVEKLADASKVVWEYLSEQGWTAFDRVYRHEATIRLIKLYHGRLVESQLGEVNGRWIRCRALSLHERDGDPQLGRMQFNGMRLSTHFAAANDEAGIAPNRLYFNDIQIDAAHGCQPFGTYFAPFGLFYIAGQEPFSKRGASITLSFRLGFAPTRLMPDRPPQINWKMVMKRQDVDKVEEPDPVTITSVAWEYWNGYAWIILPVEDKDRSLFSEPWEGEEERMVTFRCPADLEPIVVNAEENFWIRARIVHIHNAYSPNAIYFTPVLSDLRIRYGYDEPMHAPQTLFTFNNLEVADRTAEVRTGSDVFRPFIGLEGKHPAVWIGFDMPPERGPIQLYLLLKQRHVTSEDVPFMEWEYLRSVGNSTVWAPLVVADDTNGLTRSGYIQFAGPRDFAMDTRFGTQRCWIRVVNLDARYDRELDGRRLPRILDAALNTTQVIQQKKLTDEFPERVEHYDTLGDELSEYYQLSETPVLAIDVWADETDTLTIDELQRLATERPGSVETVRDSAGELLKAWVRYEEVPQFLRSRQGDRHFMIDRASGRLRLIASGHRHPRNRRTSEDALRVTYTTGGGQKGNVPAGTITSLQSAIAFVDRVINRFPAAGGCDAGTLEEATTRGPKLFTHRNRAVTAADFEWLAREAHPNVAKVKCLPGRNVRMERSPGAVSIVVLPKSGIGDGAHFQELKRNIERYLLEKAASTIAFPGGLQVMEPALLQIGVKATVWVRSMEDIVPTERAILIKLRSFLDPIHGNSDGKGWNIGQIVHQSMFYALLKSIGPVIHIPQLLIEAVKVENGDASELSPDRLSEILHGVVVSGEHRINVEVKK